MKWAARSFCVGYIIERSLLYFSEFCKTFVKHLHVNVNIQFTLKKRSK